MYANGDSFCISGMQYYMSDIISGYGDEFATVINAEVVGVRTGDKGIDKDGARKPNFEPGIDLKGKVTVLGEGSRGSLCKQMFAKLDTHSPTHPMVYGIGVKELWELPPGRIEAGTVIHSMGYPLKNEEYGGSFCYAMSDTFVALGLVIGLDYKDPFLDAYADSGFAKWHTIR